MALAITHAKVSAVADGGDTSLVQPSDWNTAHTLTGTATVAQGGTGQVSLTNHGVLIGAGISGVTALGAAAAGTLLAGVASSDPAFSATPQLGIAGTTKGTLGFAGNTSGVVTIQPAAAAGTWTWTLPVDDGTPNQVLQTDGSGVTSWATVSASPGGSNKQFQYNNSSAFGGSALTTDDLTVSAGATCGMFSSAVDISGTPGVSLGSVKTGNIVGIGGSTANVVNLVFELAVQNKTVANSGNVFGWGSQAFDSGNASGLRGSIDIGLARNAAGVLEVNSGTAGTLKDVLARCVRTTAVTFANVPATPVEGMIIAVSDSTTATWGATITGTGANHVLAYYNGTNWTVAAK